MEKTLKLKELSDQLNGKTIEESLARLGDQFSGRIVFTTSLGIEDQVITHIIFSNNLAIKVATLDTGRLFPQTYDVFSSTIIKYNKQIDVYFPEHEAVEKMVSEKGPFSFYQVQGEQDGMLQVEKGGSPEQGTIGSRMLDIRNKG